MWFLKVTTWFVGGMLAGLIGGYALWGDRMVTHEQALARVSAELATTKTWLWDEIRTSDERYERVTSTLAQAMADLATARTELARFRAASRVAGQVASPVEAVSAQPAAAIDAVTGLAGTTHASPRP